MQQDLSHPNYARHKLHEQDTSILLLYVAWCVTYSLVNITVSYYISATKAQIFMKFKNYIHKIVKNHQIIFCKDPCTHVRTQGVNVCTRTRVLSR